MTKPIIPEAARKCVMTGFECLNPSRSRKVRCCGCGRSIRLAPVRARSRGRIKGFYTRWYVPRHRTTE